MEGQADSAVKTQRASTCRTQHVIIAVGSVQVDCRASASTSRLASRTAPIGSARDGAPRGRRDSVPLVLRLDTPIEVAYDSAGGIFPYVLEQLLAGSRGMEVRA